MKRLVDDIADFLNTHGPKVSEEAGETLYFSTDAFELDYTRQLLEKGVDIREIPLPNSTWEDGSYLPKKSQSGREWHDRIISELKKLKEV